MNTRTGAPRAARRLRGMTLVEAMTSLAILAIAILGLVGGMIVASSANGRASKRTQMAEFAQSRLERLLGASRKNLCFLEGISTNPSFGSVVSPNAAVSCAAMAVGGTFDPGAAPNTGGWMLDVLDRADAQGSAAGVDQMAGPVVVLGDQGAIDEAATLSGRAALAAAWTASATGCADPMLKSGWLCREIHVESQLGPVSGSTLPVYNVWVRVTRGGGLWRDGPVLLQGVIAQ